MLEELTFAITRDVVLFALALYAAVLSTFNWRQAVRRDRRSINVSMGTAIPTYPNGELGPPFAQIKVTNSGQRPVTVTTIALRLPDGKRMSPTSSYNMPGMKDTTLPATLTDGQTATLYMSYFDIGSSLLDAGRRKSLKVVPYAEDTVGSEYPGEAWDIDPADFRDRR